MNLIDHIYLQHCGRITCTRRCLSGVAGAVQTLMSVDADRVVNLCASLHELWSLPAQIAIALYLLYTQVPPPLPFPFAPACMSCGAC